MSRAEQVELFSCDDYELINEGLHKLLEQKKEALKTLQESDVRPGGRQLLPIDFAIPQIEALIAKIDTIANDQAGR